MRVQVDNRGHLYFESPRGWGIGHEGYAMCTGTSGEATAIDLDSSYGHSIRGFTAPVISQPKPGTFPVTITRRTTDGHFKLTALWAMPDAVEKDVTVTMTGKNIGTTTVPDPELFREIEVGATGGYGGDWVVSTVDSSSTGPASLRTGS